MKSCRISEGRADTLIGAAVAAGYVVVLLATAETLGYARDEGFYFAAARSYEQWFQILFSEPARALERATVDRYWVNNHEHPSLMKALFALSHYFLHSRWQLFSEAGTAYRFPGMLMSGIALFVTYLWGSRSFGRAAGLLSAVLLAAMPRVFYHSHLACFDMPVAAMWLVATYVYFRSLERPSLSWIVVAGVAYGFLLDTKHNAWLLPPALLVHWILLCRGRMRRELSAARFAVPAAWFSMATLGPLVFFLSWPWIWFDTVQRWLDYVAFHTGHEYYNMEFLGHTYWKPPFPLSYSWVMTVATVPLTTLALFLVGLGSAARQLWLASGSPSFRLLAQPRELWRALPAADVASTGSAQLLWLLCLLMSYAPWVSSGTPIFGGTKHWITAYPFLCLFAGFGFSILLASARATLEPKLGGTAAKALSPVLFAAIAIAPVAITWHSHPYGLSAYTPIVGGASGAATLGLNRTFWGYTTGSVTDYLNAQVPLNGRVFIHDTAMQSWEMMREDGRLRQDIRPSWTIHGSDFALYHHEPHMARVEYQIWVDYGTTTPAHLGTYDGVPVVWVYRRPE